MLAYTISGQSITLLIDYIPHTINSSSINYELIFNELKSPIPDEEYLIKLLDIKKDLEVFVDNKLEINIELGTATWEGYSLHPVLVNKLINMKKEGFDITPLINFLTLLFQNPSNKAIVELFPFLENGNIPITPDGHFLAYKRVNEDFTSCYDNTTKNDVGTIVSMPRFLVNDKSSETCSHGLHVCSYDYLSSYTGDKVICCKVNPKDVVSIPTDYNHCKMRVCCYEVLKDITDEYKDSHSTIWTKSVYDYSDDSDKDESEDWYEECDEENERDDLDWSDESDDVTYTPHTYWDADPFREVSEPIMFGEESDSWDKDRAALWDIDEYLAPEGEFDEEIDDCFVIELQNLAYSKGYTDGVLGYALPSHYSEYVKILNEYNQLCTLFFTQHLFGLYMNAYDIGRFDGKNRNQRQYPITLYISGLEAD